LTVIGSEFEGTRPRRQALSVDAAKRQASTSTRRSSLDQSLVSYRTNHSDGSSRITRTTYHYPPNYPRGEDYDDDVGGVNIHDTHDNSIPFTPQATRYRSRSGNSRYSGMYAAVSNTDGSKTHHETNAPKKKVRTHSKQHVIKKHNENEAIYATQVKRARSHSRPSHNREVGGRGETRSSSLSGRIQTCDSEQARRVRSLSSSRTRRETSLQTSDNCKRQRSLSRPSKYAEENQSRLNSTSSFDQQRRRRSVSRTRSVCTGQFGVEPNVHHNSVVETEIECPVIAEMKENELYAIRNGINL
jgi:hypothetical protein